MEPPHQRNRPLPKGPKILRMTVRRLSDYSRLLRTLESQGDTEPLSSERMSRLTGFTAAQVRRDLAHFGSFGTRGVGYGDSAVFDPDGRPLAEAGLFREALIAAEAEFPEARAGGHSRLRGRVPPAVREQRAAAMRAHPADEW
jgi:hypothetical protein